MSILTGPAGPLGVFLQQDLSGLARAVLAAVTLLMLTASPAAAEVCDKIEEARAGWLLFVAFLGVVAFLSANVFEKLWPALLASGLMVFLAAASVFDLAIGHAVETAAWREGCGQSALALDALGGVFLFLLGVFGLRLARRGASLSSRADNSRN